MTLRPVREPIFKSADSHFNHREAKLAYDLVMKMDVDTAREFTTQVVADVLEEMIEKNERVLQKRLDQVIAKRLERVKKATVRSAVSKGEDAVGFAQALTLIEKAKSPYDYGYQWKESDFNRDPGSGRFRAKISYSGNKKPMKAKQAEAMGIAKPPFNPRTNGKLPGPAEAQFQEEYLQLAQFLGAVHQSSSSHDDDVLLHLQNKRTGQRYTKSNGGTAPQANWDPSTERLVGAEARPRGLTYGGAAFGLTSALGADNYERQRTMATGVNAAAAKMPKFADDWTNAGSSDPQNRNSNQRLYERMATGSKFLGDVAPAGSKLQLAAKFGEFAGNMGPEAEKVLGPSARKTAYRYRGVERKPDSKLIREYSAAIGTAKAGRVTENMSPQERQRVRARAAQDSPTWSERDAGRAAVLEYLQDQARRPDSSLYQLQLAAGNTPPSEGVILNRDGQIVSQSVGYGDDHYLPFNLKNLKGLKGGEYIRTRSVGGPTSEDIYTGLISGARKVTVTSRSGTYTIDFENDFRGGRRHNDKARRMVGRYENLLDAVQSEQVERRRLDPEIRAAFVRQVNEEVNGMEAPELVSTREKQAMLKDKITEYQESSVDSDLNDKLTETIAAGRASLAGQSGRNVRDQRRYMSEAASVVREDRAHFHQLNGQGYEAALTALQEQFPYYIQTNYQPLREGEFASEIDDGYVEPGANRPTRAAAGRFGTTGLTRYAGSSKFSASEADYQKPQKRRSLNPIAPPAKTADSGPSTERVEDEEAEEPAAETGQVAAAPATNEYVSAVKSVQQRLKGAVGEDPVYTRLVQTPETSFNDPGFQTEFDSMVTQAVEEGVLTGAVARDYKKSAGHVGRQKWNSSAPKAVFGDQPFDFDEPAYKPGATPAQVHEEAQRIKKESEGGVTQTKALTSMSDDELKAELAALGQMHDTIKENPSLSGVEKNKLLAGSGAVTTPATMRIMRSGKLSDVDKQIEYVQRSRSLMNAADRKGDAAEGGMTIRDLEAGNGAQHRLLDLALQAKDNARWLRSSEVGDHATAAQMDSVADALEAASSDHRSENAINNYIANNASLLQRVNDQTRRRMGAEKQ